MSELDLNTLFKFIKAYDGSRETLNSFLVNCENAYELASETQRTILFKYILSQLNGKAEIACSIKEFSSWEQLKEFLKNQFSERKHYSHLLTELQESRQGPQENVSQYALKVETHLSQLLTEISLANTKSKELPGRTAAMEDLALHHFLMGLHPRISNIVRCRSPRTLNEAINLAVSEERIQQTLYRRPQIEHKPSNFNRNKPSTSTPRPEYNTNPQRTFTPSTQGPPRGKQPQTDGPYSAIKSNRQGNQPQTDGPYLILESNRQGKQPQTDGPYSSTKSNRQGNQPRTDGPIPEVSSFPQSASETKETKLKSYNIKPNLRKDHSPVAVNKNPRVIPSHNITDNKVYEINLDTSKKLLPHVLLDSAASDIPLSLLVDSGSAICLIKESSIHKNQKLTKEPIKLKGIDPGDEPTLTEGHFQLKLKLNKSKSASFKFHAVIECSIRNTNLKEGIIIDQHVSKDILISNCIVKIKDNNRVNLTIANISESSISINPNLNLKVEPLHPIAFCTNANPRETTHRTDEVINSLRIDHLNQEESNALIEVCSQYSDIFHLANDLLSHTSALAHEIKTSSDVPIHTKSYRFPECHKKEVETQIDKMLNQGIIEPSSSPWSSPIWIVPKKADSQGQRKWRIVIDYRKLNDITIGEIYPIPQISEILDQLGNSKYFSTLDLTSGFHQILISPEDAPKTAFSVPQGHYQFNRMPFGLKNAPSTFQKLMNTCLSGLQGTRCFVYLDDIVIYSADLNSHINNLKAVFNRLRSFNLKLQPEKCEFLRKEVAYLGHIIGEDGVKPNPDKIKAVTNYPIPQSPKDIKSFLGLVSYYRRFIPDFAKLAKPLTSLLKKDVLFIWQNEQQLAFESLKNKLVTAPILAYPDFTQPFILTCDASNHAISAILSQGAVGQDRPIAYASRTLNKAESNYTVTEKECLAIIFGTKIFRPYLYGHRFKILTDHKPLQWLFSCKDPGSRLVRWRLKLEEFEYEIQYKKGKINSNADALSRFPVNPIQPGNPDSNLAVDGDLMDLLISPPSFNPDEIITTSPHTLDQNDDLMSLSDIIENYRGEPGNEVVDLPEQVLEPPLLPNDQLDANRIDLPEHTSELPISPNTASNVDRPNLPECVPSSQSIPDVHTDIDPIPSTSSCPDLPVDDYPTFLKAMADKNNSFNTNIEEHNESLMKSSTKITLVPTSMDLDESNPYIQEILSDPETLSNVYNAEKELFSFRRIEYNNKIYYLLFMKVHHFDESSYPEIFQTLKTIRNELIVFEDINEISISDLKNPFEKHSFVKIYNILTYLFHDTRIKIKIYHNNIIYPAPTEIKKILVDNHDIPIAGHLGSVRMYNRIKQTYYWKGMRSDIESYVKQCKSCQENKALRKINRAPMQITSTSTEPSQRISLDIVGPLPEAGPAKLKYILTIQDDLTKFSSAYPIRSTTAEETSECLLHYISIFGIPKMILTDQGPNFTSDLFKKTCEFLKIKNLWSSPYHPQTQGALERSHSTLKEYLKSYINEEQTNWPRYVYTAMLAYNTSVHSTTHFTPYELMFGNKPFIPNSIYNESPGATYPDYVRMLQNRLKYSREKALDFIRKSKESSKTYYDTHTRSVKYKIGDYVYLKNHLRLRKALSPIWKGPYKVIKINGNNTLTLLINRRHVTHHYDQVKPAEVGNL
ncbi:hypothetical protein K1T71_007022 [Dendrolimus kikuchii]|uniref:Uncharacterized protein n=1 Tax=Dendrolimus kikuchii TaxID=765133 RepID=A0ACC1D0B6_9NEOP|nr:hypothetical protein K1T71_007022 [Dendrolimus kikuchii]